MGKFIVQVNKKNEFWFDLKAANGEIIGRSEMYTEKEHAMTGIASVKTNALAPVDDTTHEQREHVTVPKYEIFKSEKDQQFYFHLKAGNGEIILASEGYVAKESAQKGIHSVGVNAPDAPVESL